MMEQYRVVKQETTIDPLGEELYSPTLGQVVTSYLVQVRGFVCWHTVKVFKKIMPAARLLKHLRELKD
jgi:hypothetical protein